MTKHLTAEELKARALFGKAMKALWASPAFKKRMSKALTGKKRSPETCAKLSEARRKDWQRPEVHAKRVKSMKAAKRPPRKVVRKRLSP